MERHVDPGRYACGRDHLAAVDEAVIATSLDRRLQFAEQVELAPIRRCGSITEQAGGCVDERARADTRHQRAVLSQLAKPPEDGLVFQLAPCALSAGIDEHVEVPHLLPVAIGQNPQPLGARDLGVLLREREHLDAVVGPLLRPGGQHFPWPRPVELLGPVEDSDPDPGHAGSMSASARSSAGSIPRRSLNTRYRSMASPSTLSRRLTALIRRFF